MAYMYEYTENIKQFGVVHIIMKLKDSDNILPELTVPVILNDDSFIVENLDKKFNEIINLCKMETIPLVTENINTTLFEEISTIETNSLI